MSQWTGYTCDRCGKEYREKGGMRIGFHFGLEEDPAEGLKRGNHWLDICLTCAATILADTIAGMGEKDQQSMYRANKRKAVL